MRGFFYGVGVGPGDPGLLTINAIEAIASADVLAVPKQSEHAESLVHSVIARYVNPDSEILDLIFPMTMDKELLEKSWETASQAVCGKLDEGLTVTMVTIGDVSVYSTCMYVYKALKAARYDAKIIPGIPSFCAAAGAAGVSLCEGSETLMILPSARNMNNVSEALAHFDNIVLMKVAGNMKAVSNLLQTHGLVNNTVTVSKCGFPDEKITYGPPDTDEKSSYFTTMIVKKNGLPFADKKEGCS